MGILTTHVLDTARGVPGEGIELELHRINGNQSELIKSAVTNNDGRVDAALLNEQEFALGTWQLVFKVVPYFAKAKLAAGKPPFLDEICLRFTISEDDHYHIPLLVSPWSYSTYRGS